MTERYSKSALFDALREVDERLSHSPTVADYREFRSAEQPSADAIQRRFSDAERPWFTALGLAGMEPECGRHGGIGGDDLAYMIGLRLTAARVQGWPSPDEYRSVGLCPSVQSIYSRFGSWDGAREWLVDRPWTGRNASTRYPYLFREFTIANLRWAAAKADARDLPMRTYEYLRKDLPSEFGWLGANYIAQHSMFEGWTAAKKAAGLSADS